MEARANGQVERLHDPLRRNRGDPRERDARG